MNRNACIFDIYVTPVNGNKYGAVVFEKINLKKEKITYL